MCIRDSLKAMKKNKKFYYKPANFTAVSGLIYRMKQNAVGLASICLLSTMVLVLDVYKRQAYTLPRLPKL